MNQSLHFLPEEAPNLPKSTRMEGIMYRTNEPHKTKQLLSYTFLE